MPHCIHSAVHTMRITFPMEVVAHDLLGIELRAGSNISFTSLDPPELCQFPNHPTHIIVERDGKRRAMQVDPEDRFVDAILRCLDSGEGKPVGFLMEEGHRSWVFIHWSMQDIEYVEMIAHGDKVDLLEESGVLRAKAEEQVNKNKPGKDKPSTDLQ